MKLTFVLRENVRTSIEPWIRKEIPWTFYCVPDGMQLPGCASTLR